MGPLEPHQYVPTARRWGSALQSHCLLAPRAATRHELILRAPNQVVKLEVLGMHCSACSTAVENSLAELPGVLHSSISLILRQANVRIDPALVTQVEPLIYFHVHLPIYLCVTHQALDCLEDYGGRDVLLGRCA